VKSFHIIAKKTGCRALLMKKMLFLPIFLLIISQVHAQFDYAITFDLDLVGRGARAAGMAYAFNAVADDATALSWNPAGIAQIKKPELAFSNSIKNTEYRHAILEYDNKPVYTFDFFGLVYPVRLKRKNLVFGVSYQNKMNFKYSFENLQSEFGNNYGKRNLTVNSVSLDAACSITRFMDVGFSYNQWFSLGNKLEDAESMYGIYADEYVYTRNTSYRFSGHNFTIGILFDFSPFHMPVRYTLKYDSKLLLTDEYEFIGREEIVHYDGADTTHLNLVQGTEKYEYPGVLTNGLSFRIGDYLTLSCDFDIQLFRDNRWIFDYSQTRRYFTGDQETIFMDTVIHYELPFFYDHIAFNQYRIGLEYILHPEFGLVPVRAGWKNNPTELNTFNAEKEPVKRVMANSLSCGTGISLKRFSIDLAYEAYWFRRMDENYNNEKKTDHIFIFSAIWYIK
jgi:hypothetical protein